VIEPAATEVETRELIQRMARRWSLGRFVTLRGELEQQFCPELPDAVFRELAEHGWLPTTAAELSDWSPPMLARLGQSLGQDAGAAFVTVLTHVVAAQLRSVFDTEPNIRGDIPLFAASPFWEFSGVSHPTVASRDGKLILEGTLPLVLNARLASLFLVPAVDEAGQRVVCALEPGAPGMSLSGPTPMLGLRGAPAVHVSFASTPIEEERSVITGEAAASVLRTATQSLAWGSVGLLGGIVAKACDEAMDYARLRKQGGRRILDHSPVARMAVSMQAAHLAFNAWLDRLDRDDSKSPAPLAEARRLAISATDEALQIFGGIGYMCPGVAERCWRDARQAAALCSRTAISRSYVS